MNRINNTQDPKDTTSFWSQHKKQIIWGLGLLLAVLGLSTGTYFYQQQQVAAKAEQVAKDKEAVAAEAEAKAKEDKEAEKKALQDILAEAEKQVKNLEKNQVEENVKTAQSAVDKVKDETKKKAFQKRIDLVKLNMAHVAEQARLLEEAERLVKQLEDNQVNENVQPAQTSVDKVGNADKKAALQHRIDLVKQAIAAREAQATAAAQASQATQQAQQPYQAQIPAGNTTYTPPAQDQDGYVAPATPADSGDSTQPAPPATQDDVDSWAQTPPSVNLGN